LVSTDGKESSLTSAVRKMLPWTTTLLVLALLWTGWVFFSRYREARAAEREAADKQAQSDRAILEKLGGDKLSILDFYAAPGAIHRGQHVSLCYGLSNAASAAIEPFIGSTKPALSRCLDVTPRRTTTYTLTAKNTKGGTITASATVTVK